MVQENCPRLASMSQDGSTEGTRDRALLSINQSRVVEEGTHDSSLQEAPCIACESQVVAFHFEEIAEC